MARAFPYQKVAPARELLIWFAVATALGVLNWGLSFGGMDGSAWAYTKLLLLQLAWSYFVFAHILALVVGFRMFLMRQVGTWPALGQHAAGIGAAFVGFVIGMFNLTWLVPLLGPVFLPELSFSFSFPGTDPWQTFGMFIGITFVGVAAVSYYTMRLNLKASYAIHLERERLRGELETAREMQLQVMPSEDPVMRGMDVAGVCLPAAEVGGDYFDYMWLDDNERLLCITWLDDNERLLCITMADVSGKGLKAAMAAVMVSGMLHVTTPTSGSPAEVLTLINNPLRHKIDARMFVAMQLAVVDTERRTVTLANAGQMPPLLLRDGAVCPLTTDGPRFPLGATEDVAYVARTIRLQTGDTLLLYTDGVNEAMNAERELFGDERLRALLQRTAGQPAAAVATALQEAVRRFTGNQPQHDDVTMVVVRVTDQDTSST
ncbi:MAG: SpoIIE family protein phosphatase [Bacteroidetes bacterium]|jgi:serine phosphatase RsbU (regulator of sigma subunit)|nr:SpoIIE family protein phosphatase [Bacteroidota bacterium]